MVYLDSALMAQSGQLVTLTFRVPTSGFTTDAATGNQRPNVTTVTQDVWIRAANQNRVQEIQRLSGLDDVRYPLFGRAQCCLPDTIRAMNPCIATCTFDGMTGTMQLFLQPKRGAFALAGETFDAVFKQG